MTVLEETAASSTRADHRGAVVLALMLTIGLAAVDTTIVATAIPQIVRDLGQFSLFPWVFSIYLITQAVTVPIYGRLADTFGRKPVLLVGVAIFLFGSILCGAAWSMVALIVFRGVQGLGAGAILPMTTTIVGDIYGVRERGRIQGYIGSVWAVSAIIGPALGGVFAQYWTWRGIFYLNIPLGLAAAVLLQKQLREDIERRAHRIDYAGALVLSAALSLVILALLGGGVDWSWASTTSVALFVAAGVLLVVFVFVERAAAEPILPPWVFKRRILLAANCAGLAIGAILIGQSSYVPTYAQGVVGVGAVLAGFAMASMLIGWPIASTIAPKVYVRIDFRGTALIGSALAISGCLLLVLFVHAGSGLWRVAIASFVTGSGLGFCSTATVVAVQSVVGWNRRGVVTANNMFIRSLGSAVGVAVFGSIANTALADRFRHPPAALAGKLPRAVDAASLSFSKAHANDAAVVSYVRQSLYAAVHRVFWAFVGAAVLGLLAQLALPRRAEPLVFEDEDGALRASIVDRTHREARPRAD